MAYNTKQEAFEQRPRLGIFFAILFIVTTIIGIGAYFQLLNTKTPISNSAHISSILREHASALETLHAQTFIPGSGDNPTRKELNSQLSKVLVGNLTDEERLQASKKGVALAQDLEEDIDKIEKEINNFRKQVKNTEQLKQDIESASLEGKLDTLTTQSSEYMQKSLQAKELLSNMNKQTIDIFERIVQQKGTLSESHITELNSAIPQAEKNFDELFFLYKELERIQEAIQNTISESVFELYSV